MTRIQSGDGCPFYNRCIPSGERLKNYGKSTMFNGKFTISMAIFNSYVTNYQRVSFMFDGLPKSVPLLDSQGRHQIRKTPGLR